MNKISEQHTNTGHDCVQRTNACVKLIKFAQSQKQV